MSVYGIDVSHHNGPVNWTKVAAAGYRFVFLKASEGNTYTDPTHAGHVQQARAAGLLVGSYHFARPDSGPAIAQARRLSHVMGALGAGRLPGVLDLEVSEGKTPAELRAWARAFLTELDRLTGRRSILYTGMSFHAHQLGGLDSWPTWIARYNSTPPPAGWSFWQNSSSGTVPGIAGRCDTNVYAGTGPQLNALAGIKPAPTTEPAPRKGEPMPPTIKYGDRGPNVRRLQALLFAGGYLPAAEVEPAARAIVGPVTGQAVKDARRRHQLPAGTSCDAQLWRALLGLRP